MRYTRLLENIRYAGLGFELVILDPRTGTGRLIGNINPGAASSAAAASTQSPFAALSGGTTVFAANDGVHGQELWATDGTAGGTHLVAALQPGGSHRYSADTGLTHFDYTVNGSFAANFANLDATRALFTAYRPDGTYALWVTDGTAAGTAALSGTTPAAPDGSAPVLATALGDGRALFAGYDPAAGTELWITDGTAPGTHIVADLFPGNGISGRSTVANSSSPKDFVALGRGRAMFSALDNAGSVYRLWTTDGTAAGTGAFATLNADSSFGGPTALTRLNNGLVVFENHVDGFDARQLWVTDGTSAGTHALITGVTGPYVALRDNPAVGFGVLADGRALFFLGVTNPKDTGVDRQLWSTDGTDAGTRLVRDFGTNTTSYPLAPASSASPRPFVQLQDGRVAFTAGLGTDTPEVWVSDGTAAGTQVLGHIESANPIGGLSGAQLVDAPFYYDQYADVVGAGVAAAAHYDASGWREGRDPDAFFSTPGYLSTYKDVGAAGINPLNHYDAQGWREGRDTSAAFDTSLYLLFNPDVKAAGIDPLAHWLANGQVEGRKVSAVVDSGAIRDLFDLTFYSLSNSDVAAAGIDLRTHFNTYGVAEGRNPDAYFDVKYYLARNPDVAASGINPVAHYLDVGWREGRDPSTHFSTTKYLAAYGDVGAAGVNPLQHFLTSGIIEGRTGFGDRI